MILPTLKTHLYTGLAVILAATSVTFTWASGSDTFHDINDILPVRKDGARYTSQPFGERLGIQKVAQYTRSWGEKQRISTRGMKLPGQYRIVDRYDYTFPDSCGGARFSYYESDGFSALGIHHDEQVIIDVIKGGSPYTAPRLWGAYDQVLNDRTPMQTVVSFNGDNGSALLSASFVAGKVTGMNSSIQETLGNAYSSGIYSSSRCHADTLPGTLVVTK